MVNVHALGEVWSVLRRPAPRLYSTFNERDFTRLSVAGGPPIVVPPDPPAVVL